MRKLKKLITKKLDLIPLTIAAIRQSDSQNNAYVLLLNETDGKRQLPIVIGWCEARSIAIALDGEDEPERPLTHDLFKSFGDSFNIKINKVIIHTLNEGVFHSIFYCSNPLTGNEVEIDARTSDAVAIAIRFSCPIFTYEHILSKAGINFSSDDKSKDKSFTETTSIKKEKKLSLYSLKELEEILLEAIEHENYERASVIRDEIKRRTTK